MENILGKQEITAEKVIYWCLCGAVFFLLFSTSLTVIFGVTALSLWMVAGKFWTQRERLLRGRWVLPVSLFMAVPWIGLIYSKSISDGLDFAMKSHYWLYAFVAASLPSLKNQAKGLMNTFLFSLLLIAVVCIFQFAGIFPLTRGVKIGFINSITHIHFLVFGMLLLSFYYRESRRIKQRILFASGMVLLCINIFLFIGVPGRTAYLSFVVMMPFIVSNLAGRGNRMKTVFLIVITGIFLYLSPVVQDPLRDTKEQISFYNNGNPNTSVGLRLHMWNGAYKIFSDNPLLGVGTGGYQSAMRQYRTSALNTEQSEFSQPHNSFLYMAANFGIVGIASLCWVFYVLLLEGWRQREAIAGFSLLSFTLVVIIGSLTDTQIIELHTAILLALITGIQKRDDIS